MIKKENKSYEIFEINDYIVEIDKTGKYIECWLYKKDYCIKIFMFGIDTTDDDYLDILIANVDEYIENYEKEYCNE